jgi:hypothetical protein
MEYYEGRRTKAPKNAARTASKGSKRKQITVDKVQGYAVSQVSVYRQQVSQFCWLLTLFFDIYCCMFIKLIFYL